MKHSQHTPGPWKVVTEKNKAIRISCFREDGELTVAFMRMLGTSDLPEVKANARLIATAPELLEALKNLSKYVVGNTGAYPAELVKAKLAIAKAEGRDVA